MLLTIKFQKPLNKELYISRLSMAAYFDNSAVYFKTIWRPWHIISNALHLARNLGYKVRNKMNSLILSDERNPSGIWMEQVYCKLKVQVKTSIIYHTHRLCHKWSVLSRRHKLSCTRWTNHLYSHRRTSRGWRVHWVIIWGLILRNSHRSVVWVEWRLIW